MKTFMIVEDAPVIRKVANRILSDLGFLVVEAADGFEALDVCRNNIPEAMIVDWEMPRMNGVEFIQEFRQLEGSERTKVLYCTTEVVVPDMTRAKRAGATGFIMKPFNREILEFKLQEAGVEVGNRMVMEDEALVV